MKVTTTSVTQTANEVLGTPERKLYYLILENTKNEKMTINVGQKTHDQVLTLVASEQYEENKANIKQQTKKV